MIIKGGMKMTDEKKNYDRNDLMEGEINKVAGGLG